MCYNDELGPIYVELQQRVLSLSPRSILNLLAGGAQQRFSVSSWSRGVDANVLCWFIQSPQRYVPRVHSMSEQLNNNNIACRVGSKYAFRDQIQLGQIKYVAFLDFNSNKMFQLKYNCIAVFY